MNLFKFLKSRMGAVSINAGKAAGLAVTAGMLGLSVYNYVSDTPSAAQERVRSFSDILASGGNLPGDTTNIQVSAGNVQLATAEEIAAREGSVFDGGDAAVAGLEGAFGGFSAKGRALSGGEDGLGLGANAAEALGVSVPSAGGAAAEDGSAVRAAARAAYESAEGGPTLKRAEIARASGSNLGSGVSAGGGFGGGASAPSASSASRSGSLAPAGDYTLTGAMPKGSTLIASKGGIQGAADGRTQFMAGGRQGHSAGGINSKEGRSLREIAVASSKVAANANRAANEGSSPFMAKEHLSGGIVVDDGGSEFAGSSSSDFDADRQMRERGFAQEADSVDNREAERKNHRSRLAKMLICMIPTVFVGMMAIQSLKSQKPWGLVAAIAITAILAAIVTAFTVDAAKYIHKYKTWDGWAIASLLGSAVMFGGLALAWAGKAASWLGKVQTFLTQNMGMMWLSSAVFGTFISGTVTGSVDTFKSAFGSGDDGLKNG